MRVPTQHLLTTLLVGLVSAYMANAGCAAGTTCQNTPAPTCGGAVMYCCSSPGAICSLASNGTITSAYCLPGAGWNYPTAYWDSGCNNAYKAATAGPRASSIAVMFAGVVAAAMAMMMMLSA